MQVAIVTGGSRGLGAGIASALALDGYAIAVTYSRDRRGAEQVVDSIISAGGMAKSFCFDVRDEHAVMDSISLITETLGLIEIIVSNAIGTHAAHAIEEQNWDHYQFLMDYCVKAPLFLLKAVVKDWKIRRSGCFINIGSESVNLAKAHAAPYLAAKAAMIGTTRSWAQELGPFQIRVNLVCPGFIPVERHSELIQDVLDDYARHVPLHRLGLPSDIGNMVAFLASPRGAFITGQTLHVNGGRTMT